MKKDALRVGRKPLSGAWRKVCFPDPIFRVQMTCLPILWPWASELAPNPQPFAKPSERIQVVSSCAEELKANHLTSLDGGKPMPGTCSAHVTTLGTSNLARSEGPSDYVTANCHWAGDFCSQNVWVFLVLGFL